MPHVDGQRRLRSMIRETRRGGDQWYAICLRADAAETIVGTLLSRRSIYHTDVWEIGYRVAPGHRSQGIATEAVAAIVSHIIKARATAIEAFVRPGNHASLRVLRRNAFERDGMHSHAGELHLRMVHRAPTDQSHTR